MTGGKLTASTYTNSGDEGGGEGGGEVPEGSPSTTWSTLKCFILFV